MSRVYWDTMLFIYWMENHPQFAERVDEIRTRMQERQDQLITGAFTFGEVLAGVYRKAPTTLLRTIRQMLEDVVSEIIPFDLEAADHYAHIRGALGLRPADSIQLACAARGATDLFLTNENQLVGKNVPGIQFIASLDTPLF